MSEETFGPAGRPRRSDDFEVRREEFAEKLNIKLEPKAEPEFIPPEPPWDADRKSWWTGYLKRNPQARPKPREIKKLGQVAPGVDGSEYLAKLLNEIKTLLANYAIFEEKLAAFEQKQLDECTSKGPQYQWIDSECVRLDVTGDGANPENLSEKSKDSEVVNKILSGALRKGKFIKKNFVLDEPWKIIT